MENSFLVKNFKSRYQSQKQNSKFIIKIIYVYIFYLLVFAYINVKFYRLGEYGTDIAAQLIVLILIPLILITLKKNLGIAS